MPDASARLSPHFTLRELDAEAAPPAAVVALVDLARAVLEPLRTAAGCPLRVTSGFRTAAQNAKAKGSPNSQHLRGQAADFRPVDADGRFSPTEFARMARSGAPFDQLILYASGFVHASHVPGNNRGEVLTSEATGGSGGPYHPWAG